MVRNAGSETALGDNYVMDSDRKVYSKPEKKTEENKEMKDDKFISEVLILGAGMAGVAAAETLNKLGVKNVMIVEGSDRKVFLPGIFLISTFFTELEEE